MNLGNLQIHMGQQGFISYVVPLALILCGLLSALTPDQRLFYGIIGVLNARYSFIGLNLCGFFLGMVLGITVDLIGMETRRPGLGFAFPVLRALTAPAEKEVDAFFLRRNPGYVRGDEMVCLTELAPHNLRPLARRVFEQGLRAGAPPT